MRKKLNEIIEVLERPTPPSEVSFIPRGVKAISGSNEEGYATAIPYIDSAYVDNTLDEAAGKFGWQSDIKEVAGVMCQGIGISSADLGGIWIWRWDVGIEKEQEEHGSKAEVTAGRKRCASQWGIGRDLKDYPKLRLRCKIWVRKDNKAVFIKWAKDPRDAVMAALESGGIRGGEEEEKAGAAREGVIEHAVTTGAVEGEQVDDVTPLQARRMCYDYAVQQIEMTSKEANAWIIDQEKGNGKTIEAYRAMYGILKNKHKANQPPD